MTWRRIMALNTMTAYREHKPCETDFCHQKDCEVTTFDCNHCSGQRPEIGLWVLADLGITNLRLFTALLS